MTIKPFTATDLTIVEGPFAYVGGGNCSRWWIEDGDDVQERANRLPGRDYGTEHTDATIFERGYAGWAIKVEGVDTVQVHTSRRGAEEALDRIIKTNS